MRCLVLLASVLFSVLVKAQSDVDTRRMLHTTSRDFFKSDEARRVGDLVVLWQRSTGGWPKNVDMVSPLSDEQLKKVQADKTRRNDSTTDNGATNMQMSFLARLYQATGEQRYKDSFLRGVEYLLSGQYENGGWPQFWPVMRSYQIHITYNDDAMVNTMELLREISKGDYPYNGMCNRSLVKRMRRAFDKGVECILNTQIRVGDTLTVWCQQHDRETLLPAPARSYELASYCSLESARIVKLLMSLPKPDKRVRASVMGAMAWFEQHKLSGKRYIHADGFHDASLIDDPTAANSLWARYYDLEKCLPFVCDRDGVMKRSLDEIGRERRNGYSWYGTQPESLFPLYKDWLKRYVDKR